MRSYSKEAKRIIRDEMLSYFAPRDYENCHSSLEAMKRDADAGNGGAYGKKYVSDYQKGAYLVDSACLAIYDQDRMLNKVYDKQKVSNWDNLKQHEVYKHLIAREYSSMLNESRKNNKSNLW